MKSVRVPAKINLHLEVVGLRSDGFHELRTLFQSVAVWDVVTAEPWSSSSLELEIECDQTLGAGPDNLVLRAARALREHTGQKLGAKLRLKKDIPMGGGMGGGSADAAATLVLLNDLWNLGLGRETLHELAASLGSDVPFFLYGGLALGTGRGEEVWPLPDLEPMSVVLVFPSVEISTPDVFRRLDRGNRWSSMTGTVYSGLVATPPRIEWASVANDLQAPACSRYPEVASALRKLESERCVHAAMTGSGSCVFAVFRNPEEARREAQVVLEGGAWLVETLTRGEAELRVEAADLRCAGNKPA